MIIAPCCQYLSMGNLKIYIYGIILAFAIYVGINLADKLAVKFYNINTMYEQAIILIIFGLLGARLYFCLLNFQTYFNDPIRILNIREGGISIHGAIFTGLLTIYFLSKKYNYKFLNVYDIFGVILPLAQSIGRWGNFFNSEAFGHPTNNPILKLYVAPEYRPIEFIDYNYFHPTFLYESFLNLILFIIMYKIFFKKMYKKQGLLSGIYLVGYSIIRLLIEPLRVDCTSFVFNIPVPIFISVLLLGVGVIFILYALKKSRSSK